MEKRTERTDSKQPPEAATNRPDDARQDGESPNDQGPAPSLTPADSDAGRPRTPQAETVEAAEDDFAEFGPRHPTVLVPPDDADPEGESYEAADVATESWFDDTDGEESVAAYRTGRAIHALGWLCVSLILHRVDREARPGRWQSWSIRDEDPRAESWRLRAGRVDRRERRAWASVESLCTLLIGSAHRFASGPATEEMEAEIAWHPATVQETSLSLDDWLRILEERRRNTEEVAAWYEPGLLRFPFDLGECAPYTCRRLEQVFLESMASDLRDRVGLGLTVDALFRGPVPVHGPTHCWLGMPLRKDFRVRPREAGRLLGTLSRLGGDGDTRGETRPLLGESPTPDSIAEIDEWIRGTLRKTPAPAILDRAAPLVAADGTNDRSDVNRGPANAAVADAESVGHAGGRATASGEGLDQAPKIAIESCLASEIEYDAESWKVKRRGFDKEVDLTAEMARQFEFALAALQAGTPTMRDDWHKKFGIKDEEKSKATGRDCYNTDSARKVTSRLNAMLSDLHIHIHNYTLTSLPTEEHGLQREP